MLQISKHEIEERLAEMKRSTDGSLYVYITKGSACNSPIVSKRADWKTHNFKYEFDSYGAVFKNWADWERCGNYGGCGSFGYCNDLKVVYDSCLSYNKEHGRVALITEDVLEDLQAAGHKVHILDFGFE